MTESNGAGSFDLGVLFAEDEVLQEIDPSWSGDELLEKDGVFPFSEVVDTLGLDKKRMREFAKAQMEKGVDVYAQYGLKKLEGGQWRVRMKTFRDNLDDLKSRFTKRKKPGPIQKLPEELGRDAFFQLKGFFKLKDVMSQGYLPYDFREVLFFLKKENLTKETCGCWKGLKEWYVDFVPFVLYLYSRFQNLPLEQVRAHFERAQR